MTDIPPPQRSAPNIFGTTAELQMVPPGDDPLEAVAMRAEAECDRLGWGSEREAELAWFWLYDNGSLPGGQASLAMGRAEMSDDLAGQHPVHLIEGFGKHMTRVDRQLIGFVLVHEAWMVLWEGDDVATRDRAMAAAGRREIWRQPDRQEVRIAELQMLTGQHRTVMRIRGGDPMLFGPLPVGDSGAVPAAMRHLATTLRRRKYGRRG